MDFDLGRASSRAKREQQQRREAARKKLAEEKAKQARLDQAAKEIADRAEALAAEKAAEEDRVRQLALEVERRTGGVAFSASLRPVPTTRADDKLILPPSALASLEPQGALELGPMAFTVQVGDYKTNAGVAEFTAEEGVVGIPPKVALSLMKDNRSELSTIGQVAVTFVRIDRCPKASATFQPRGKGFHKDGDVVNIDLKAVLERTLTTHTCLSTGDWLPIRHDGVTYELKVVEITPEPAIMVVNTDLEITLMPSEAAEAERVAKEEAVKRQYEKAVAAAQAQAAAAERCRQKAEALAPEPPEGEPNGVRVLLRLPGGKSVSRRFRRTDNLQLVLDFAESLPELCLSEGSYVLVQSWPGHRAEFDQTLASKTLQDAGLSGRQEALHLQRRGDETEETEADDAPQPMDVDSEGAPMEERTVSSEWTRADREATAQVDQLLAAQPSAEEALAGNPEMERLRGQELVEVFNLLRGSGVPPQQAAGLSQKWGVQLRELGGMGFTDWMRNAELLQKYQGRLVRVVNALSEAGADVDMGVEDPSPLPAPSPAAPEQTTKPNFEDKLVELAGMGFTDTQRNTALLEKYQGRLERVVNILCGGD
mmetsp:Transcript_9719/g.23135  ORF Transcript_9719/g.23135 Transcript_9719/m.23135 type:complete len:597 (+) Transcript_9719:29-1819(+)